MLSTFVAYTCAGFSVASAVACHFALRVFDRLVQRNTRSNNAVTAKLVESIDTQERLIRSNEAFQAALEELSKRGAE